jgi:hypothetical protein
MGLLSTESGQEFTSARQKAFIEEWLSVFTGRHTDLLSFEEIKQTLRLQDSAYKGLQEIELDKIVGSVGRYRDFTRTFLPKRDSLEDRWRRVDIVTHEQGLPPIDVYKVGAVYFVRDGNHRVSVARTHGAKTIEAYVTEYKTPVPIEQDDDLDDLLLKMDRAHFLKETQLDVIRPDHNIEFTEPGRYRHVQEHIAFHKFLKELERNREIPYEEAVASWYDTVYTPIVSLIRERQILKDFPDRTEADLYAWLMKHRAELEHQTDALGFVNDEELIEAVRRSKVTNPVARLMGFFRGHFNIKTLPLKIGRSKFLEWTAIDQIRPENNIEFTEPGCYQLAQKHIEVHKYLKEVETTSELSRAEAVASWYDHVYLPVVNLIRERGVLKHFPKNTEGDLYIWLVSRREILENEDRGMGQIPTEKVIWDLENEVSSNSILSLNAVFGQKLDLDEALNGHNHSTEENSG